MSRIVTHFTLHFADSVVFFHTFLCFVPFANKIYLIDAFIYLMRETNNAVLDDFSDIRKNRKYTKSLISGDGQ